MVKNFNFANFITTTLPAYVKANEDVIIKNVALRGVTIERIHVQPGVKGTGQINVIGVNATFGDGSACGWTPNATAELSGRPIKTGIIKVNLGICERTLVGYYAEYLVKISANGGDEPMPFEEYVVNALVADIRAKLEKAIWQGDTASQLANFNKFDGFIKIAGTDVPSANQVAIAGGTAIYDAVEQIVNAITNETFDKAEELGESVVINIAPEKYRAFVSALVAKNYFHYNAGDQGELPKFVYFPGTNVKVMNVAGLAGNPHALATFDSNLYYGTDLQGNEEEAKVWHSDDADEYRVKVLFNAGVQIAYPDLAFLATFA